MEIEMLTERSWRVWGSVLYCHVFQPGRMAPYMKGYAGAMNIRGGGGIHGTPEGPDWSRSRTAVYMFSSILLPDVLRRPLEVPCGAVSLRVTHKNLDSESTQNNCPKPPTTAQEAMILHTSGVYVALRCPKMLDRSSPQAARLQGLAGQPLP